MRISVVLQSKEIPTESPDLVVFPEGVSSDEILAGSSHHPNTIIVGAVNESDRMRGVLLHDGKNRIDYLKIGSDGRTQGSGDLSQELPLYEFNDICVGVVICMDVEVALGAFCRAVVERIGSSDRYWKFLCVPADMAAHWFAGDSLPTTFAGMHVVVCNHTKTHQVRLASFVTDTNAKKIQIQQKDEPLRVRLPKGD